MVERTIKQFLSVTLLCCMFGCAGKTETVIQYVDRPVEVKVPVMMVPAIKPITKPYLPINDLKNKQNITNKELAEGYYNSLMLMMDYSNKLEKQLKPFYEEYKKHD